MKTRQILSFLINAALLAACDTETPSSVVVDNSYPAVPENGDASKQNVIYRAWWVATYFPDPVAGGAESSEERTVPSADFAYAVMAPGWDPASSTPPSSLLILKSKATYSVDRGDTLHIPISDQTFSGNCLAGMPLSQDDADFITQRIFPGEFMGLKYDAKTCTTTSIDAPEAGPDATTDAPDGG